MQYLLAHDLGTSGDKASLFTVDGHAGQKRGSQLSVLLRQRQLCGAKSGSMVCSGLPDHPIPGVSGGPGPDCRRQLQRPYDGRGAAGRQRALLRPAIIWADQRAVSEQALLSQRVGDRRLYEITGNRNNPTNSICKIMWSMAHDGLTAGLERR